MGFSWGIHMVHGSDQKLEQTITGGVIIIFNMKFYFVDELTELFIWKSPKDSKRASQRAGTIDLKLERCVSTFRHIQTELNMIQMLPKLKIIYSPNQVYLALQF